MPARKSSRSSSRSSSSSNSSDSRSRSKSDSSEVEAKSRKRKKSSEKSPRKKHVDSPSPRTTASKKNVVKEKQDRKSGSRSMSSDKHRDRSHSSPKRTRKVTSKERRDRVEKDDAKENNRDRKRRSRPQSDDNRPKSRKYESNETSTDRKMKRDTGASSSRKPLESSKSSGKLSERKSAGQETKKSVKDDSSLINCGKMGKFDFGKNHHGEVYDCNVHIRVCLNAERVKRLSLPKANTLHIEKLVSEKMTAGLHAHWLKKQKNKFRPLFDREDVKESNTHQKKGDKEEREGIKTLSDRWKTMTTAEKEQQSKREKQVVKVDVKSLGKFFKNDKDGRASSTTTSHAVSERDNKKVSVKSRLGDKPNATANIEKETRKTSTELTKEDRLRLDPKFVPRTGRYFLHDDRDEYFGGRDRSPCYSNRGDLRERVSGRGRFNGRVGRGGGPRSRKLSPDVWKHDKFGKESESEAENGDFEDATTREFNQRQQNRQSPFDQSRLRGDRNSNNFENEDTYTGQKPFYAQIQDETHKTLSTSAAKKRSPPHSYRRRSRSRSRSFERGRMRQGRGGFRGGRGGGRFRRFSPYGRQRRYSRENRRRSPNRRARSSRTRSRSSSVERSRKTSPRSKPSAYPLNATSSSPVKKSSPPRKRNRRSRSSSTSSSSSSSRSKSRSEKPQVRKGGASSGGDQSKGEATPATVVSEQQQTAIEINSSHINDKIVNYDNDDDLIEQSMAVVEQASSIVASTANGSDNASKAWAL